MNAQRGLNLLFNVLLARSRLREGGEGRQSGREMESGDRADVKKKKKTRPETEEESWWRTAPSLFFVGFPNFAIPRMISDSEPNVLLDLEP